MMERVNQRRLLKRQKLVHLLEESMKIKLMMLLDKLASN